MKLKQEKLSKLMLKSQLNRVLPQLSFLRQCMSGKLLIVSTVLIVSSILEVIPVIFPSILYIVSKSDIEMNSLLSIFETFGTDVALLIMAFCLFFVVGRSVALVQLFKFAGIIIYETTAKYFVQIIKKAANTDEFLHGRQDQDLYISSLSVEYSLVVGNFLIPLFSILFELIVLLVLCGFIFYVDAKILLLLILVVIGLTIIKISFLDHRLNRNAEVRSSSEIEKMRHLQDIVQNSSALIANREIEGKIAALENEMMKNAISWGNLFGYQKIPKIIVESFIFVGLGLLVALHTLGFITQETLLLLVAQGALLVRLLPSLSRIMAFNQSLQHGFPAINKISGITKKIGNGSGFKEIHRPKINPFQKNDSSYQQSDKSLSVQISLHHLNRTIKLLGGNIYHFTGKSGLGKSTLGISLVNSLNSSQGGFDFFDNWVDIDSKNIAKAYYVPQSPKIYSGSILQFLFKDEKSSNNAELWKSLESLELAHWISELPNGINTNLVHANIKESGGQLQRLAILRALNIGADLIFLDETLTGFDIKIARTVLEMMRRKSKIVCFTAHQNIKSGCIEVDLNHFLTAEKS